MNIFCSNSPPWLNQWLKQCSQPYYPGHLLGSLPLVKSKHLRFHAQGWKGKEVSLDSDKKCSVHTEQEENSVPYGPTVWPWAAHKCWKENRQCCRRRPWPSFTDVVPCICPVNCWHLFFGQSSSMRAFTIRICKHGTLKPKFLSPLKHNLIDHFGNVKKEREMGMGLEESALVKWETNSFKTSLCHNRLPQY